MSTSDLAALERRLNEMILAGRGMQAFEEMYADDVVMQENFDPPCVGKNANREREERFFASIAEFHGAECIHSAVGDGVTFSEWTMDVTLRDAGRLVLRQVARRIWRDGQVVHERFYYSKG
jgi:hypothetical protein